MKKCLACASCNVLKPIYRVNLCRQIRGIDIRNLWVREKKHVCIVVLPKRHKYGEKKVVHLHQVTLTGKVETRSYGCRAFYESHLDEAKPKTDQKMWRAHLYWLNRSGNVSVVIVCEAKHSDLACYLSTEYTNKTKTQRHYNMKQENIWVILKQTNKRRTSEREWTNERMNERSVDRSDEWIKEWKDEWTNERMIENSNTTIKHKRQ